MPTIPSSDHRQRGHDAYPPIGATTRHLLPRRSIGFTRVVIARVEHKARISLPIELTVEVSPERRWGQSVHQHIVLEQQAWIGAVYVETL